MFVDFSRLSINAQRLFVHIERRVYLNGGEARINKEDMMWDTCMSWAGVKVALRELKKTGYVISRNDNSCYLRIGEQYAYKEKRD